MWRILGGKFLVMLLNEASASVGCRMLSIGILGKEFFKERNGLGNIECLQFDFS